MAWSIVGLCVSFAVMIVAWWRMRVPATYYDGQVYGMTPKAHRSYLLVELSLCAIFALTMILHADWIALWFLAAAAIADILYLSSFIRGATEEE